MFNKFKHHLKMNKSKCYVPSQLSIILNFVLRKSFTTVMVFLLLGKIIIEIWIYYSLIKCHIFCCIQTNLYYVCMIDYALNFGKEKLIYFNIVT